MKYFYIVVFLLSLGACFWAANLPDQPTGPAPKMIQQMNAIDTEQVFYSTICFKGKKLIRIQNSYFYELDDNGHLIPCNVK